MGTGVFQSKEGSNRLQRQLNTLLGCLDAFRVLGARKVLSCRSKLVIGFIDPAFDGVSLVLVHGS
jgi:hypothetical protein